MKKTLIAAAVMAASGVAFAASNVTLYGVVDTSAVFTHDGGATDSKNVIDMQSGFRNGSRWGIKGVEELGNGYAVGFILENGFNSDDGTNGQKYSGGFSRESKLYISGEFGQIGFGRLGSLANGAQSNSILSGWALGTSYQTQGTLTSFMKDNGRVNNAVAYVSPSFAGLTVHAMYSNGTDKDTAKWAHRIDKVPLIVFNACDKHGVYPQTFVGKSGVGSHHLFYRHIHCAECKRKSGVDMAGHTKHSHFIGKTLCSQRVDKTSGNPVV